MIVCLQGGMGVLGNTIREMFMNSKILPLFLQGYSNLNVSQVYEDRHTSLQNMIPGKQLKDNFSAMFSVTLQKKRETRTLCRISRTARNWKRASKSLQSFEGQGVLGLSFECTMAECYADSEG